MSKYTPLGDYLRKQRSASVPMTFAEIERIVGFKLPRSQRYPAWWSNNPANNVMTEVWLNAGFESEQVDIEGRKLVFRRAAENKPSNVVSAAPAEKSKRHSLIGWLKGTIRITPGTDLAQPADPDWGEHAWGGKK
jgi:hypothetical protein